MTDLLIICPSYKRPDQARELYDSFLRTKKADSRLRFAVWNQDRGYEDLPASFITQEKMTPRTNVLALWAAERCKYIGWVADDNRFETDGWDTEVIRALETTPIVFCNDQVSPGSKPSHVFMDSRIVKSLGRLIHPDLKSTFFDDVWANLGVGPIDVSRPLFPTYSSHRSSLFADQRVGGLGIGYLHEVRIPHFYKEHDNRPNFLSDMETYQSWLRNDCEDDIRRASKALRRKDALAQETASPGV